MYEGVSLYDAFIYNNARNCYLYTSPLVLGEDQFTIDVNFVDFAFMDNANTMEQSLVLKASVSI